MYAETTSVKKTWGWLIRGAAFTSYYGTCIYNTTNDSCVYLLSIIVVVNAAVACGTRRSIGAVAFSKRGTAVEVVLGIIREGQG